MKKVINTQGHPVTPEGAPVIPAYGRGRVDETLAHNQGLIGDGTLTLDTSDGPFDAATATDGELVAWIRDEKPEASAVVAAAGENPALAARVLEAEQAQAKPRKTVVEPLEQTIATNKEN